MFSWKKRTGVAFANAFELYDIAVYSAISFYIGINFFPSSNFGAESQLMVWMAFALRFISRPFGGICVGIYADKYGRKKALIFTSTLTGIATLIMACLPNFEQIGLLAPCLFFLMQLIQAFCFGGENATSVVYLMENTPQNERGKTGALLWGIFSLIVSFALILVYLLKQFLTESQMTSFGWRIPLILGFINLIFSVWIRMKLSESASFKPSLNLKIYWKPVIKTFLIAAPCCMLSYMNLVLSAMMIKKLTNDAFLQDILPIVCNIIFCIAAVISGYLIDKYSCCKKTLNKCYIFMIVFCLPIYALQEQSHWIYPFISQILIIILVAISLAASPSVLFDYLGKENKSTSLGIGHNLSVIVFGGFTPLLINYLSQYGKMYIGLLLMLTGFAYFLALALDKHTLKQPQKVQHA